MKILIVCTGNLCRSPMAEGFLHAGLKRRGVGDVEISSAGTWGVDGEPPTRLARVVMADRGIDISAGSAVSLQPDQVEDADLLLVMTSVHRREVLQQVPEAATKVVLMKELHEMTADGDTAQQRLAALLERPRPQQRRSLDLDDPMGLPLAVYERCAQEISASVDRLLELIWP